MCDSRRRKTRVSVTVNLTFWGPIFHWSRGIVQVKTGNQNILSLPLEVQANRITYHCKRRGKWWWLKRHFKICRFFKIKITYRVL